MITLTDEQFASLRKLVGISRVTLEGNIQRFKHPTVPIDLTKLHTQWLEQVNEIDTKTDYTKVTHHD